MKTSITRIMIRFFSLMLCLLLFSNISIGAQDLQALDEQAKERAANATEINNGDLYDYVEKSAYLGQTKDNYLYVAYYQDGKFLDYKEYLKWK